MCCSIEKKKKGRNDKQGLFYRESSVTGTTLVIYISTMKRMEENLKIKIKIGTRKKESKKEKKKKKKIRKRKLNLFTYGLVDG